ncbi:interferon a3-like [Coregonus clupeaformis]|uniref:interferon a3-like n=1 Tax=Coregonus clupeaformis TaxID=59861 RepID=UPI001BE05852|nr:interferon a3-like [Coregonus clupeaformis]
MYTIESWTCICLIICSMQSVCHCCDWIPHHYGLLSAEYLSLLDQMGGDITEQNAFVYFPESLYRPIYDAKFDDKVRFLNETIFQITKLFHGNMTLVTWNKTNLTNFVYNLERQFKNLQSCVSPDKKPEWILKSYFMMLNDVLIEMHYSEPAWELIRTETKLLLERLDILVGQMH